MRITCCIVLACFAPPAAADDVLYVSNDSRVSRVSGAGVSTVVGGLDLPNGLARDAGGTLFVAEGSANRISRVTSGGAMVPFATGIENPTGLVFDSAGNLYAASLHIGTVWKITPAGTVAPFSTGLDLPYDLAFDEAGNLYVSNFAVERNQGFVTRIAPSGQSTVFARGLDHPDGLAFDAAGDLFLANFADNGAAGNVVRITPDGVVHPFARVNSPTGLAFGTGGNLYVASHFTSRVSRIAPDGTVTGYAEGLEAARELIVVPEPTSLALLSAGGVCLFRRRVGPRRARARRGSEEGRDPVVSTLS